METVFYFFYNMYKTILFQRIYKIMTRIYRKKIIYVSEIRAQIIIKHGFPSRNVKKKSVAQRMCRIPRKIRQFRKA